MVNPRRRHAAPRSFSGVTSRRRQDAADLAIVSRCLRFSGVAAWLGLALGLAGFLGWATRSRFLLEVLPGSPPITLATAFLLVLGGAALLLSAAEASPWQRRLASALGLGLAVSGAGMLLANLFGWTPVSEHGLPVLAYPPTALAFGMLGLSLVMLDAPRRAGVYLAEVFALATVGIPYVALLGYAFGIVLVSPRIAMAVHVAIALMLLGLGVLCARPRRGWMAAFTRASPGGLLLRRFLPAIKLGPPLLGLLRIEATHVGLLSEPLGIALLVLIITAVTLGLAVWNAMVFDRLDSERKRSEEYLRQFQLLVSSVTDYAIFLLDRRGRVRTWNASAERLKGYRDSEILGSSFRRFFTPDEIDQRLPQQLLKEAATRGRAHLEGWRVERDGSRRWEELSLTALRESSGQLLGFAVIIRDMTERKLAYEEVARRSAELSKARDLNQLKDHFLSTISHEIRTPLSLITGYSELLEETGDHPDLVAGIQEGSRRLKERIDQILDYSALLSGALPLYPTDVNLAEVAANARALVASEAARQGQAIVLEVEPETPPIHADSRRVTQMIAELLSNAQAVTPPGGRFGVRIGPRGSSVRIDVWDSGPGISEEDFPLLWEPFSQLQVGNAVRRGGLGLGLTIVRKLAELHGGGVAVVSQPGHGSTFTLTLPVSGPIRPAPAGSEAEEREVEPPGEGP